MVESFRHLKPRLFVLELEKKRKEKKGGKTNSEISQIQILIKYLDSQNNK